MSIAEMYNNNITEVLDHLISQSTGDIAVLVTRLNTNVPIYHHNTNQPFVIASLIKLLILCKTLDKIEHNELRFTDVIRIKDELILKDDTESFPINERTFSAGITIKELLKWMIIVSCNTSTNILIDLLGIDKINNYAKQLRLSNTSLNRMMCDRNAQLEGIENYATMTDIYRLYHMLWTNEILTPSLCAFAKTTLYNQRRNHKLLRYISYPVLFAHKTGGLPYVNHDAGILHVEDKDYFIGVLIQETETEDGDLILMGMIGETIISYLTGGCL